MAGNGRGPSGSGNIFLSGQIRKYLFCPGTSVIFNYPDVFFEEGGEISKAFFGRESRPFYIEKLVSPFLKFVRGYIF